MDKDFNDKIRASFEESAPKAPEGIWDALDGAMSASEQQMDNKLKEAFAAEEGHAPEGVWAGINRQLTIDQAWIGINRYLNRRIAWMWTQRAAAVLLLAFAIYYGNEQWSSTDSPSNYIDLDLRELEPNEPVESTPDLSTVSTKGLEPGSEVTGNSEASQEVETSGTLVQETGAGSTIPPESGVEQTEGPETSSNLLAEVEKAELDQMLGIDERQWLDFPWAFPNLGLAYLNQDWEPLSHPHGKKKSLWKDFSFGFEYSYNRDVLSNNIYRESQDPRSLVRSNAVYSNNYKFVLHYHLQKRWSLKMAFQPQRAFRLDYNTFREGQYVSDQMTLHYTRIGLGLEHHKSFNSPFGITLGVEPYYGFLNAVEGDIRWRDYDDAYGLQMRLGADWQTGRLVFSLGVESDFNFNNLYLGDARIPSDFDRTLYRSWGLYIGSRYRFF